MIDCVDIDIICKDKCFTYRLDQCQSIRINLPDPGSRVTFYCSDSPNVQLTVDKIQWNRSDTAYQPNQNGNVVEEDDSKNEDDEEDGNGDDYPDYYDFYPNQRDKWDDYSTDSIFYKDLH